MPISRPAPRTSRTSDAQGASASRRPAARRSPEHAGRARPGPRPDRGRPRRSPRPSRSATPAKVEVCRNGSRRTGRTPRGGHHRGDRDDAPGQSFADQQDVGPDALAIGAPPRSRACPDPSAPRRGRAAPRPRRRRRRRRSGTPAAASPRRPLPGRARGRRMRSPVLRQHPGQCGRVAEGDVHDVGQQRPERRLVELVRPVRPSAPEGLAVVAVGIETRVRRPCARASLIAASTASAPELTKCT